MRERMCGTSAQGQKKEEDVMACDNENCMALVPCWMCWTDPCLPAPAANPCFIKRADKHHI